MDASPSLVEVLDALQQVRLEAILIGGAAAALQGAPITTIDFDFHFRASNSAVGFDDEHSWSVFLQ